MIEFLYSIPAAVLLVVAIALSVGASCLGQVVVHRRFRDRDFVAHNEVGGIMIAVSGTIYAVILGFLTVVAWEHFQEARELVVLESDSDIDVWHTAVGLPSPLREQIRADMANYASIMTEREWPLMRHGDFDKTAAMITMDAIGAVGTFNPATSGQSNAQSASMQLLTVIHDARQRRVAINAAGISWFQWLVLVVGAVGIVGFCWLFGLRNQRTHLLMTSIVVSMIAANLVLLFELQYPFRSDIGIGPELWDGAVAHIKQMDAGHMMK